MNNCCCAELVVDEGQQIELNVESDGGIEVGVAEQFVIGGGGNYQDKTVNITPTESAQSQTVHADVGYDALDEVEVNVAAIADDYVGSSVPRRSVADLDLTGAKFTAPAGYYSSDADKTMTTGHMSVSATKGTVSNHSVAVTPKAAVDNAGYFATGDRTGTAVTVSASELDSGTKSITSNGNSQDVVGYAAVDVNVPNSYTSADEGKVVDNGALVAQTSDTVTQNGTVDTTLINSLTVNVSGGGGSSVKSGTYTPVSNTTSASFDIGDSTLSNFLLYALSSPLGNSVRVGYLARADFNNGNGAIVLSNSSGSSFTATSISYNSVVQGVSKSGSTVTISGTGTTRFNSFIGGVTYQWYAW